MLPGWEEDISECKEWDDLPTNAQVYVRRVEVRSVKLRVVMGFLNGKSERCDRLNEWIEVRVMCHEYIRGRSRRSIPASVSEVYHVVSSSYRTTSHPHAAGSEVGASDRVLESESVTGGTSRDQLNFYGIHVMRVSCL